MDLLREKYRARGHHLALGGGTPDNSGQNQAALMSAQLSKEQLDWAKQLYAETAPERAEATARANAVSDAQLSSMGLQDAITRKAADNYEKTYLPLEQKMAADASGYDTQARRNQEVGRGLADVTAAFSSARDQNTRALTRMGVNPSDGRTAAANTQLQNDQALASAGAANTAVRQVETMGAAKLADAVNLGRGIASSQATTAGLALNAGNSSTANAGAALNATTAGAGQMNAAYGGAMSGLGTAGNLYGSMASQQTAANNARNSNTAAGVGAAASLAGATSSYWAPAVMALLAGSDKNIKTDIKSVDPKHSLAAIVAMDAKSWRYKRGSSADDGGKEHVGPMAQDVHRTLGEAAAPGGKMIDLVSMNGHLINSVKELNSKVLTLADAIKKTPTSGKKERGTSLADAKTFPPKRKTSKATDSRSYSLKDALPKG